MTAAEKWNHDILYFREKKYNPVQLSTGSNRKEFYESVQSSLEL